MGSSTTLKVLEVGNINRVIMFCSSEISLANESHPKASLTLFSMINHSLKSENRLFSIDNKISFVDGGLKRV